MHFSSRIYLIPVIIVIEDTRLFVCSFVRSFVGFFWFIDMKVSGLLVSEYVNVFADESRKN